MVGDASGDVDEAVAGDEHAESTVVEPEGAVSRIGPEHLNAIASQEFYGGHQQRAAYAT